MSTDFVYTELNVKTVIYQTIHFRVSTVSMSKPVPFQTIHFSLSTRFQYKYNLIIKNISISAIQFSQTVLMQRIPFSICKQLV